MPIPLPTCAAWWMATFVWPISEDRLRCPNAVPTLPLFVLSFCEPVCSHCNSAKSLPPPPSPCFPVHPLHQATRGCGAGARRSSDARLACSAVYAPARGDNQEPPRRLVTCPPFPSSPSLPFSHSCLHPGNHIASGEYAADTARRWLRRGDEKHSEGEVTHKERDPIPLEVGRMTGISSQSSWARQAGACTKANGSRVAAASDYPSPSHLLFNLHLLAPLLSALHSCSCPRSALFPLPQHHGLCPTPPAWSSAS